MLSNKIEEYKKTLRLSDFQRQVLVGILLGDACLETLNNGRTYRLKVEHSIKQKSYLLHLFDIFKNWILQNEPILKEKKIGEKVYYNLAFSTVSCGSFRFYAHQFYDEYGKKRVPRIIKKLLDPVALAYWFMDDGSVKSKESKGLILNTHSFSESDIECLIKTLKLNFNLIAKKRRQKEGIQIYISGNSGEHFIKLIDKYLIPEMRYKIPKPIRLTYLPKE